MLSVSNTLKTTALAALLGLGAAVSTSAPASADTISTRCYGDDCYRVRCNDLGFNCVRTSYDRSDYDRYYDRAYDTDYAPAYGSRMVCDADGDNCHYTAIPRGHYDAFGVWHDDTAW